MARAAVRMGAVGAQRLQRAHHEHSIGVLGGGSACGA
jgi:hypothetical protein